MTEAEWLRSDRPLAMLLRLLDRGEPSDRKLRLYYLACHHLYPHAVRTDDERAYAWVDGKGVGANAATHIWELFNLPAREAALAVHYGWVGEAAGAGLLREVFGNPFAPRPLRWRDGRPEEFVGYSQRRFHAPTPRYEPCAWVTADALRLAHAAYDARDFSGLPILADCLEEAGCPARGRTEHLLRHLRGEEVCRECGGAGTVRFKDPTAHGDDDTVCCPQCNPDPSGRGFGSPDHPKWFALRTGNHCRGCWALDLILGKD